MCFFYFSFPFILRNNTGLGTLRHKRTRNTMGLIWSLIIGGIAGWLAGTIMKGEGYGVLINILLGIVGGLVGGWVFSLLGIAATNIIGQLICATFGAVLLILLVRKLR